MNKKTLKKQKKTKAQKKPQTLQTLHNFKIFTFERYSATDDCAMVKIYDNHILEFYIDPIPLDYNQREKLSYKPEKIYTKKVKTFKNIQEIFYGKDPEYLGGKVNAILIRIKKDYVYISSYFYKFKTNKLINRFVSEDYDGWILSIAENNENYYLLEGIPKSYINKKYFPNYNIEGGKYKSNLLDIFIESGSFKKKKYLTFTDT